MDVYADSPGSIPSIQYMFSGKCVLITGATGFVGKVLLEKLVRSCSSISQILVLIRHDTKCTSSQRLQKLFESNVFGRVKKECPGALQKIRELDGDVTMENLALNENDLNTVLSEVHFVFHCAASVRFESDPRSTLNINFLGVQNVLKLCRSMTKLMAFVHVSTAYSFCNQTLIAEKIYTETLKVEQLQETMRWMNDEQLKDFCAAVSKSRPSLYQFSKAMAEIYLSENCGKLPIIIVRPSIITAAAKEPFPGWIDNLNGPTGFIALSSKGILKTLQVRPGVKADFVPVDIVVNTIITAAHHVAVKSLPTLIPVQPLSSPSGIPVINCVCPDTNSMTWLAVIKLGIPCLFKYPSLQIFRSPGGIVTSSPVLHVIAKYIYHYIPAAILDLIMLLLLKKARFVKAYKRIHGVMQHLRLYTLHKFTFTSGNMRQLTETVAFEDREVFPLDQNNLDWEQYFDDYVHGVRQFYLKEDDKTLMQARKKLLRLRCLYFCGKMIPIGIILIMMMKHKPRIGRPLLSLLPLQFFSGLYKTSCRFIGM